jgi:hypothetical protein
MENMEEITEKIYLANINEHINCVGSDYPNDRLGVADKFILSCIIRKEGRLFGKGMRHYNFVKSVNDEMRKYGFIGREFENI